MEKNLETLQKEIEVLKAENNRLEEENNRLEEELYAYDNCRNEGMDVEIQCIIDAQSGKVRKAGYRAIVSEWDKNGFLIRNHYLPNRKTYEEAKDDANRELFNCWL